MCVCMPTIGFQQATALAENITVWGKLILTALKVYIMIASLIMR